MTENEDGYLKSDVSKKEYVDKVREVALMLAADTMRQAVEDNAASYGPDWRIYVMLDAWSAAEAFFHAEEIWLERKN